MPHFPWHRLGHRIVKPASPAPTWSDGLPRTASEAADNGTFAGMVAHHHYEVDAERALFDAWEDDFATGRLAKDIELRADKREHARQAAATAQREWGWFLACSAAGLLIIAIALIFNELQSPGF